MLFLLFTQPLFNSDKTPTKPLLDFFEKEAPEVPPTLPSMNGYAKRYFMRSAKVLDGLQTMKLQLKRVV